ncbi:isoprenyl transferase [Sphingomonadales bacterium 56]|uniref:isoprenyl transferase n=1 Tax=unclassified Sphingobium TaxID=2611147 RepID=UPI00191B4658|nr:MULTISPECIES: isoprenyl transferase [unclassified Sphingobium]MBY2927284.1 isoprenyl transferase [Sphingomonadales bacterium 56]MBY2957352.1 isoprenyl transferase [Sphingomonadales bacterium 58]CAD7334883.1 Ditrans,polycis-undecaprenyl-diphosphate synthase ((2E,6E)-farnesyl-diphosphate specific) [Sphingobium sp. S8]CAD7334902.1 Ditrans,polycis-undecaprenyl-diphosphate synthase ((2E,6E)-farnesyl-diphosphate specific) [Sphingobium sp. S6]
MATQAKSDFAHDGAPGHGARHVAIIMDGNGRWAKKRFLPRIAGHRAGVEAVRKVARAARDLGLECLTLYAFSSENWKRPASEVADLMGLLRRFIESDLDEFHANGVRLRVIGNYRALDASLVDMIDGAVARTAGNSGPIVAIALNYGAQDELVRAAQAIALRVRAGEVDPAAISLEDVAAGLDTADLPPLDLLIRTSGEQRLSNFMLWQAAYAELYFTDTLWPDFDARALAKALDAFRLRDRRFGGL